MPRAPREGLSEELAASWVGDVPIFSCNLMEAGVLVWSFRSPANLASKRDSAGWGRRSWALLTS